MHARWIDDSQMILGVSVKRRVKVKVSISSGHVSRMSPTLSQDRLQSPWEPIEGKTVDGEWKKIDVAYA